MSPDPGRVPSENRFGIHPISGEDYFGSIPSRSYERTGRFRPAEDEIARPEFPRWRPFRDVRDARGLQ